MTAAERHEQHTRTLAVAAGLQAEEPRAHKPPPHRRRRQVLRSVLVAVRKGAADLAEVVRATGLPTGTVLAQAFALRGDGARPRYLCCADGMPWALTLEGLKLLLALDQELAR